MIQWNYIELRTNLNQISEAFDNLAVSENAMVSGDNHQRALFVS